MGAHWHEADGGAIVIEVRASALFECLWGPGWIDDAHACEVTVTVGCLPIIPEFRVDRHSRSVRSGCHGQVDEAAAPEILIRRRAAYRDSTVCVLVYF